MPARKAGHCIKCSCKVETNESAVSILLFCRTVGVATRITSKTERLYLCTQCASQLAMGSRPSNGAINVAVYEIIRELVGKDPAVIKAAWEELNRSLAQPAVAALPEPEFISPPRRLLHPAV